MSRLHDLQFMMAEIALDRRPAADLLPNLSKGAAIPVLDRLRVHRNNTQLGLLDPLRESFPVVADLVGKEFFEVMALDFIRAHPPKRPDLLNYGQELPGFIASYGAADSVPYLADMARLELALMVADHARDATPLQPAMLQDLPPDQLESLCLAPLPSLRFVASDYPLLMIWQAHQQEGGPTEPIDLDQGSAMLLVYRPHHETLIRQISGGAFDLVMALAIGQPLHSAYQSALCNHPEFTLSDELAGLLAAEIFMEPTVPCDN